MRLTYTYVHTYKYMYVRTYIRSYINAYAQMLFQYKVYTQYGCNSVVSVSQSVYCYTQFSIRILSDSIPHLTAEITPTSGKVIVRFYYMFTFVAINIRTYVRVYKL